MNERDEIPKTARRTPDTQETMPPEWRADREFASRVLAGDETAVTAFTRRMAILPAFVRSRNRKLGGLLTTDEIEDLVQDALVIIWRRLESFSGHSALETWACSIACYEMMNALRRKRRRQDRERALPDHHEAPAREPQLAPGDPESLSRALAELPAEDLRLLQLKHREDLSFTDLGELLGLSTSGAKNRYYRVLERLRRRLVGREAGAPS